MQLEPSAQTEKMSSNLNTDHYKSIARLTMFSSKQGLLP